MPARLVPVEGSRFFRNQILPMAIVMAALMAISISGFCGQIQNAAANGNLEAVKALLKWNPGLSADKDQKGKTALHWAASEGQTNVVEFLLDNKADVNVKDTNDWTPLHYAADSGYRAVAELLLRRGADVNAHDIWGKTPLDEAKTGFYNNIRDGRQHENISDLLSEHGGKEGWTQLMKAAAQGDLNGVRAAIEQGDDVSAKDFLGKCALMLAAEVPWLSPDNSHLQGCVRALVYSGADVNAKDNSGKTVPTIYLEKNDLQCLSILLSAGAKLMDVPELIVDEDALPPSATESNAIARMRSNLNIAASFAKINDARLVAHFAAMSRIYQNTGGRYLYNGHQVTLVLGWNGKMVSDIVETGFPEYLGVTPETQSGYTNNTTSRLLAADIEASMILGKFAAANGHQDISEMLIAQKSPDASGPFSPEETLKTAASLLGEEDVGYLYNQAGGGIIISDKHPARLHLVTPALPITDKPTADSETNSVSKGKWGIMGTNGIEFGSDSGKWFLSKGELQFSGSVAVGSHLVVFLNGEIESRSFSNSTCLDGAAAQVDSIKYELSNGAWKPSK